MEGTRALPAWLERHQEVPDDVLAAGFVTWLLAARPSALFGGESPRTLRLRQAWAALSGDPAQAPLRERLSRIWRGSSAVRLLAEVGIADQASLTREALHRIADHLIPRLDPEGDLYALVSRLPLDEEDARWMETLPDDVAAAWGELLEIESETWFAAARLVAYRAAGVGLSRDLLELRSGAADRDSPFFRLSGAVDALARRPGGAGERAALEAILSACRGELAQALERLDQRGVETDLLFRLELLEVKLARVERLVGGALGEGDGRAFAAEMVRGAASQRSVRALLRGSLKLLLRKVVEHTGETGEHYVAGTREEYRATAISAGGGGILTSFTAALKFGIHHAPLAPGISGIAYAANYAGSFIVMQLLHLTLASKMPAMTAASLAAALEKKRGVTGVVQLAAGITRSQFVAALGNVLLTIPASIALDLLVRLVTGASVLSDAAALETLGSLHPLRSLTIPFATLTGVLLWLGSLASGLAANWSAHRCLPEAIAKNLRVVQLLGLQRAARLGRAVETGLSGIVGSLALGFLLGFVPVLLAFVGIGLEVRHVTLSAASLGLALGQLLHAGHVPPGPVLWALAGIAVIGVLNITVSFALALWTATHARDLSFSTRSTLARAVRSELRAHPGRFLFPPRQEPK